MRNLLIMAIAMQVVINETDATHLGYDVTEEDFRAYFEIPEETVVDVEAMTSNFRKDEDFSFEFLKKFMTGKEQKLYKEKFPVKEDKSAKPAAKPDKAAKPAKAAAEVDSKEADAKIAADKKKADDKAAADAAKAAKKVADDTAKAAKKEAKDAADKEKADAKAAAAAEKAAKKEADAKLKADKLAAKKAPKALSRSQEIQIYHTEEKTFEQIKELHPDWNEAHIRNALYYAKQNPDVVAKTVEKKAEFDAYVPPVADEATETDAANA